MDIIYLNDLRIDTLIGVFDWERRIRQTLVFDIEMATDIRKAAETDDLQYTLDYGAVANRVIDYVSSSEFQLVETLVERVAGIIQEEFKVPWVRIRINKQGAVAGVRDIGVIIERGEKD